MSVNETIHQEEVSDLVLYADEIEYFETHDLGDELANSPEVHFEINPQVRSRFYFEVEPELRIKLQFLAKQRGIPAKTLLNEWVREKTAETEVAGVAK